MISENQHYSRQDLLAALEQGWHRYLSRLHEVSEKEQILYAQAQGFARVEDVLVHIVAWWERSMQRSFMILNGETTSPMTGSSALLTLLVNFETQLHSFDTMKKPSMKTEKQQVRAGEKYDLTASK